MWVESGTEEFKIAAVKQMTRPGHPVSQVGERFGVSAHGLYAWTKHYGVPEKERKAIDARADEMRRLKAALKHATAEGDIWKKRRCSLPRRPRKVNLNC